MKSVKQVIRSEKVNMGGIILDQPLPNKFMDQIDPFLLIHHWDDELKGGKRQKKPELVLAASWFLSCYFNI